VLGFGAASAAFVVVAGVLLLGWRGGLAGALLLTAVCLSAAWAGVLAAFQLSGRLPVPVLGLADGLRAGAWLAFLAALLWPAARASAAGRLLVALCAAVVGAQLLVSGALWLGLGQDRLGQAPVIGSMIAALLGLVAVEQLLRNATDQGRWALKYMGLGVGAMFAYDLFLYADALLVRRVDLGLWSARGAVNALVAPLIAVSAARNPAWSLDVYLSRRFVLHTAAIIGAGAYLVLMAAAGYSIRAYGGVWGEPLQIVFLFGALLVLLVLVFSGQIRARARVFMSKHFFNYRYDYRDEWLRFVGTLSAGEGDTPLKQRVIHAVAQVLDSPAGQLWQRRDGAFVPTAQWNLSVPDHAAEPADGALAAFLGESGWVLTVDEWRQAPERYQGLAMPEWLAAVPRAWVVVPLFHHEELNGFLVLSRSRAVSRDLNWEDCDLLKTIGRQAATFLAQEEAAEALGRAQQFETFNRLSAFVLHDLKNIIGQLSLLARNAHRHKDNPAFMADAVKTLDHSVERMNHLMAQLRGGVQDRKTERLELTAAVREAIRGRQGRGPEPVLEAPADPLFLHADPDRLTAVVGHVIQNAREATPDEGEVRVRLGMEGGEALLEVVDTGAGMPAEFVRERLFRPFDTSKGSTGMGIGAFEAREFARGLGGDVEVVSAPGEGTRFRFRFPGAVCEPRSVPVAREASQ